MTHPPPRAGTPSWSSHRFLRLIANNFLVHQIIMRNSTGNINSPYLACIIQLWIGQKSFGKESRKLLLEGLRCTGEAQNWYCMFSIQCSEFSKIRASERMTLGIAFVCTSCLTGNLFRKWNSELYRLCGITTLLGDYFVTYPLDCKRPVAQARTSNSRQQDTKILEGASGFISPLLLYSQYIIQALLNYYIVAYVLLISFAR
jgi:hypothetical protein